MLCRLVVIECRGGGQVQRWVEPVGRDPFLYSCGLRSPLLSSARALAAVAQAACDAAAYCPVLVGA